MFDSALVSDSFEFVKEYYNSNFSQEYTYHNFEHTCQVAEAVTTLASVAGISKTETEYLVVAALFHDTGFHVDPARHETISSDIADKFLKSRGVPAADQSIIRSYILSTEQGWQGDIPAALYLRDADLSGLANPEYALRNDRLREELKALKGETFSDLEWIENNIEFFKTHQYQSPEGKAKYKKEKKRNLKRLLKMRKVLMNEHKTNTITSSRTAQTQLKTTLRNHIDLSAIADNKSNIMLSINAVVLTVGLPLMANLMSDNRWYLVPIATLAIASIISMTYATMATRPIKMNGRTNIDDIQKRKTNLFFFGNFYKMDFDDYEAGIKEVVKNEEILENAITRDIFDLGRSLGEKFSQLRICYNVFMIGMLLTGLLFVIISVVDSMV